MRVGFAAVAVVAFGATASAGSVLDKPAFTATPDELLAAAKSGPSTNDVAILREDEDVRFDDRGRRVERWRLVFVVRSQTAADDWRTLYRHWHPFYQDRPSVRARAVAPDGKATELDAASITDTPTRDAGDARNIQGTLSLQPGSVVEEEVVTTDRVPIIGAGGGVVFNIGTMGPTASSRISLSAPIDRKVHHVEHGLPAGVRPKHELAAGRESWTYEIGATTELVFESFAPSDDQARYVGMASAPTWNAIARELHTTIVKQIAAGPFVLPNELPRTPTLETAKAIVAWFHHQVRHSGIDLSSSTFEPATPADVIKHGSADALGEATLLVALLGQAGLRADAALVDLGPGTDVQSELPRVENFDRVIVRLRIGAADTWIDPNEDLLPAGHLPSDAQGRRALVLADDVSALVTTPIAAPADNTVREVRTFELAEEGLGRVTEVSHESGVYEAGQRRWVRDNPATDVLQSNSVRGMSRVSTSPTASKATPDHGRRRPFHTVPDHGRRVARRASRRLFTQ